ncbi:hypothetical protein BASA81_007849 [Batrachochytrium salamandrivorans]|nr:hypothetical protein BASA81_007849 [Batrachochytrium salamandrivorans]
MSDRKTYTMEEVGKHRTEKDCWMVIDGKVLDLKEFLSLHPGGDGAGKDATDDFEDTGHSSDARKQLEQYVIGVVEGYVESAERKSAGGSFTTNGPSPMALLALVMVILAALFVLSQ